MSTTIIPPRIRIREVMQMLACSKSHVYRLHERRLLIRHKEGRRFAYWIRSEVEAFARGINPYEHTVAS